MTEPYRIKTAISPKPMSLDDVREYFEKLRQKRAVNPERQSARIIER